MTSISGLLTGGGGLLVLLLGAGWFPPSPVPGLPGASVIAGQPVGDGDRAAGTDPGGTAAAYELDRFERFPNTALPESSPTATLTTPNGASTPTHGTAPRGSYSLLQINLCLSGSAECFDATHYPKVVEEATEVITARDPSAVSFNEACSGDIARIAQQTRYHMRFAAVRNRGQRLPCRSPAGRGVFGNAVITKDSIGRSADRAFTAQAGGEVRRWLCVETVQGVNVCTTHLSTRGSDVERVANERQCVELAAVLTARQQQGPVLAAGDINAQDSCATAAMWTRTDASAAQLPGKQHSYGSAEEFGAPRVQILPATYTDHDFMLTRTRVLPPRRPVPLPAFGAGS